MKQLLQSEFNKGGKIYKNISSPETSGTQTQVTNINLSNNLLKLSTDNGATFIDVATQQGNSNKSEIDGLLSQTSTMLSKIGDLANNNINIKNANSGFSAGEGATAEDGGAIGQSATAKNGGAIGWHAKATSGGAIGSEATATTGGAVGGNATATTGGAVGDDATATSGGAIGERASATGGGAIGIDAKATDGGAIGWHAKAGNGFSGGYNAGVGKDSDGAYIDAIQLGTGTNNTPKTLQVYDYKVYDFNKDSLYGHYLNDKTPAVIETVWSGDLKNDGSTTITVSTSSQYDYFILWGRVQGIFCNIIPNRNGTYGFAKKSDETSSVYVYSLVYENGSFTWGQSGFYSNGDFTFQDRTGTQYYALEMIEGVKLCKA